MLCPFCLAETWFRRGQPAGLPAEAHFCSECGEQVPALYVEDYSGFPPVVVSAVGFRQHGKTVYFASLFYALKRLELTASWPEFFTMSLDEDSLDTVYGNVRMLEGGALPDSTPKNFPRPTMVRLDGIPLQPGATLLLFDTGGECFERPTQLVQFAGFVRRARTAMLLISVPDLQDCAREMHRLLNTYIVGLRELGGHPEHQHLLVVYTKADELAGQLGSAWTDLAGYLREGSVQGLAEPAAYLRRLQQVSARLESFTRTELQAIAFLNAARAHFSSLSFCMVSALGSRPQEGRLPVQIVPRRVLDPLFWTMDKSLTGWQRFWSRWRRW